MNNSQLTISQRKKAMKKEIKAFHSATEKYLKTLKNIIDDSHPSEVKHIHTNMKKIKARLNKLEKRGDSLLK